MKTRRGSSSPNKREVDGAEIQRKVRKIFWHGPRHRVRASQKKDGGNMVSKCNEGGKS